MLGISNMPQTAKASTGSPINQMLSSLNMFIKQNEPALVLVLF